MKYVAPEDIHVYSIDEVFMDVTNYLEAAHLSTREFTKIIIKDILDTVGITATAGIGTNLYLCKIAMDIVAKHIPADDDGVRIAELDEITYRRLLWSHEPITDFGVWEKDMLRNLKNTIYILWELLRDVPLESDRHIIMKICYTNFLGLMHSFS